MFPLFVAIIFSAKTSMFQHFYAILDKPRPSPSPIWHGKEGVLVLNTTLVAILRDLLISIAGSIAGMLIWQLLGL